MILAAKRGTLFPITALIPFAIPDSHKYHTIYINGSVGIASGAVIVETSDDPDYAGTWAQVIAPTTLIASTMLAVTFIGVYKFLRVRASTAIAGGTATYNYLGS